MEGIKFGDKEANKINIYKNKKLFKTDDIDVHKTLISKKESYIDKKSHLSVSWGMIIMMKLNHYL